MMNFAGSVCRWLERVPYTSLETFFGLKSTVENRTDGTLDDGQPIRTSPVIVEKLEFRPKMEERL